MSEASAAARCEGIGARLASQSAAVAASEHAKEDQAFVDAISAEWP